MHASRCGITRCSEDSQMSRCHDIRLRGGSGGGSGGGVCPLTRLADTHSLSLLTEDFACEQARDHAFFRRLADVEMSWRVSPQTRRHCTCQPRCQNADRIRNPCQVRDHALFRRLADVGMSLAPEAWDEQSVANLLNAFAKHSQVPFSSSLLFVSVFVISHFRDYDSKYHP